MSQESFIHQRRSTRLDGYNYASPGAYFVTTVTSHRLCLFGDVINSQIFLSHYGEIVQAAWKELPKHYLNVTLDEMIVMPNHVHAIVFLCETNPVGAGLRPAPTEGCESLTEVVRAFKSFSARRINTLRNTPGIKIWQRSFYDRIIRDNEELNRIRMYILENTLRWEMDTENPSFRAS